MVPRRRFLAAYAALVLMTIAASTATWRLAQQHRPGPLAPGAVVLVQTFLGALQHGDLNKACRLFSSLPSCDPTSTAPLLRSYTVSPAEPAVDGVDVPATLNGEYAVFSIAERLGRYRIVDIIADPAAFSPTALPVPLVA
jgi:hypothetical protein